MSILGPCALLQTEFGEEKITQVSMDVISIQFVPIDPMLV